MKELKIRKIIREEIKLLKESRPIDASYLANRLDDIIRTEDDLSADEITYLDNLSSQLKRVYPQGDVIKDDIIELSKDFTLRKYTKRIDLFELLDYVWTSI